MRRLILIAITLLILFSITVENQINAQHRRARTRTQAISNVTTIEEVDRGTLEERAKLAEECATPGRAKPEVEVGKSGKPMLCGHALSLPKPAYPPYAKAQKISGTVAVSIVIDEKGRVIWAQAVDGHPLLRQASVKAACQSLYSPTKISGRAVKVLSILSYNFVNE
jgi:TonB family protein